MSDEGEGGEMPFFEYKAVSPEGKVIEGTLEAADHGSALIRIQELGQLPIKVSSEGDEGILSREFQLPWQRKRVPRQDLLVFTQELATLVQAGLPLDRSLTILSNLAENEYLAEIVGELLREIKAGKSLSEGLAAYPHVFPKLYVNMVRAGEASGSLNSILQRLVEYLESSEELRNYFTSALIYPAILTVVGGASIIIMVTFVIPKFAAIFENAGAPVPFPMQVMLLASAVLTGYWWLAVGLALAGGYFLARQLKTEKGRLVWDERKLRIPMLGPLIRKLEVSRFSRTLGTLLKSAVPLIHSINIVREIVNNRVIATALDEIKKGVKKGDGLARPVAESRVFPPFAVHLLEVGEETGRLDDMLLQVADTYDREIRNSIKRLVAMFEPLMILFMGLVIGAMVVSMLYSIFSINDVPL